MDFKCILNTSIHRKSKQSRSRFLEKIENVNSLRSSLNRHLFSVYITDQEELLNIKRFYDLINRGKFYDLEGRYVFAVNINSSIYNWFRNNELSVIERQIFTWLAATYAYEPFERYVMEEQVYHHLLSEIKSIANSHFSEMMNLNDDDEFPQDSLAYNESLTKYIEVQKKVSGLEPPKFLSVPGMLKDGEDFGFSHFDLVVEEAYMTENDWDRIVLKGAYDNLNRVDAKKEMLDKWKFIFTSYDLKKSFVYDLYFESVSKKNSSTEIKRKPISSKLRIEVWQRDKGVCVDCGSKENLEFDHIIPVSKGGATSFRNLQLLCEKCNRTKSDKIQ